MFSLRPYVLIDGSKIAKIDAKNNRVTLKDGSVYTDVQVQINTPPAKP